MDPPNGSRGESRFPRSSTSGRRRLVDLKLSTLASGFGRGDPAALGFEVSIKHVIGLNLVPGIASPPAMARQPAWPLRDGRFSGRRSRRERRSTPAIVAGKPEVPMPAPNPTRRRIAISASRMNARHRQLTGKNEPDSPPGGPGMGSAVAEGPPRRDRITCGAPRLRSEPSLARRRRTLPAAQERRLRVAPRARINALPGPGDTPRVSRKAWAAGGPGRAADWVRRSNRSVDGAGHALARAARRIVTFRSLKISFGA